MTRTLSRTRVLVTALALALAAASAGLAAPARPRKKPATKAAKARDYAHTLALLHTSQGDVTIRFFHDRAPNHVKNFIDLAASGFYDGTLFHRVIRDFIVQGGDPLTKDPKNAFIWGNAGKTDAKGNPVTLKPEFNDTSHKRGIVSMARSSAPDSASSQFFIVLKDYPSLDRQYTVFGEVVKGMDVVDRIASASDPDPSNPTLGKPRNPQKLLSIELLDEPAAPAPTYPAPAPKKS
ncbi:MAG TPA: peptidylprolyl isomerase [Thermoanaerobaculia bacterium]|nr:peptidylprolyl isomerase [Thermoanaerobaculia bacterium]